MEKLVELLNEYDNGDYQVYSWRKVGNHIIAKNIPLKYELDTNESEAILISKDYEFIKRLVENDKIDESKIYCDQGLYYSLLCKLAISDTPIEDLISYLKE